MDDEDGFDDFVTTDEIVNQSYEIDISKMKKEAAKKIFNWRGYRKYKKLMKNNGYLLQQELGKGKKIYLNGRNCGLEVR